MKYLFRCPMFCVTLALPLFVSGCSSEAPYVSDTPQTPTTLKEENITLSQKPDPKQESFQALTSPQTHNTVTTTTATQEALPKHVDPPTTWHPFSVRTSTFYGGSVLCLNAHCTTIVLLRKNNGELAVLDSENNTLLHIMPLPQIEPSALKLLTSLDHPNKASFLLLHSSGIQFWRYDPCIQNSLYVEAAITLSQGEHLVTADVSELWAAALIARENSISVALWYKHPEDKWTLHTVLYPNSVVSNPNLISINNTMLAVASTEGYFAIWEVTSKIDTLQWKRIHTEYPNSQKGIITALTISENHVIVAHHAKHYRAILSWFFPHNADDPWAHSLFFEHKITQLSVQRSVSSVHRYVAVGLSNGGVFLFRGTPPISITITPSPHHSPIRYLSVFDNSVISHSDTLLSIWDLYSWLARTPPKIFFVPDHIISFAYHPPIVAVTTPHAVTICKTSIPDSCQEWPLSKTAFGARVTVQNHHLLVEDSEGCVQNFDLSLETTTPHVTYTTPSPIWPQKDITSINSLSLNDIILCTTAHRITLLSKENDSSIFRQTFSGLASTQFIVHPEPSRDGDHGFALLGSDGSNLEFVWLR